MVSFNKWVFRLCKAPKKPNFAMFCSELRQDMFAWPKASISTKFGFQSFLYQNHMVYSFFQDMNGSSWKAAAKQPVSGALPLLR